MENTAFVTSIPLNQLVVSKSNIRKVPTGIEELSENILSHGLIQNLTAVQKGDLYEVVAGGRRLTALQLLAKQKRISNSFYVPVRLIEQSDAHSVSLSENTAREQMHPADEFEAFKKMVDDGQSVEVVAAKFGVSPTVVNRRLKLANASPALLKAFRDGEMALDILMALVVTDNHEVQEAVWADASHHDDADDIRSAVLDQTEQVTSDHKLVVFVGLEDYQKAGGVLQADLFSENTDGGFVIVDTPLLIKLAKEKMQALADQAIANGSAWVETSIDQGHRDYNKYLVAQSELMEMPQDIKDKISAIEARIEKLEAQQEATGDSESDFAKYRNLQNKIDALNEKMSAIEAPYWQFSEAEKPYMGQFIGLDRDGEVKVFENLIRREDQAKINASKAGEQASSDDKKVSSKPVHSTAHLYALSAHRTVALQATVANDSHKALVILIAKLLSNTLSCYGSLADVCKASVHDTYKQLSGIDSSIEQTKAYELMTTLKEKYSVLLDSPNLLVSLDKLPQAELLSILAFLTATSLNALDPSGNNEQRNESFDAVGQYVGLDVGQWFTTDVQNYWGKLSKEGLIAKILEKDPSAQGLDKHKRGELAQMAGRLHEGTGFLPEIMKN